MYGKPKKQKMVRAALHCKFYICNITIFLKKVIVGDFGTKFLMTIQLVPNTQAKCIRPKVYISWRVPIPE